MDKPGREERNPDGTFKKGVGGGGRPALPDEIKEARRLALEDMLRAVAWARALTTAEAKALDPEALTLGERVILKGYIGSDVNVIKMYEDRLFGKAKETIDINDVTDYTEQAGRLRQIINDRTRTD